MKRDMDLVCDILLAIEADDPQNSASLLASRPALSKRSLVLAILGMLIDEAGLVGGIDASRLSSRAIAG